jgi:chorismate synthase
MHGPLRFLTAGESHGPGLTAIVEGIPAGLAIDAENINLQLKRRQFGYGRGGRMKIENDKVQISSGLRNGLTMGSPLTLSIINQDYENWLAEMPVERTAGFNPKKTIERPRPGHADYAGMLKYDFADARNVLERSSARETTARVAAGSIARIFLEAFDIAIASHIMQMGPVEVPEEELQHLRRQKNLNAIADKSPVRCLHAETARKMIAAIDSAKLEGDTLGGVAEVIIKNVPVGLGSYTHWDRRLDSLFAAALMSIQAVKGIGVGLGFRVAALKGSEVHDQMQLEQGSIQRKTNNAGGIEGGMTNGEPVILRVAMKPISTLRKPLQSVNLTTGTNEVAHFERSDVAAVAACGVVAEAMSALVLGTAFLAKFGADAMSDIQQNYQSYTTKVADKLRF